MGSVIEVAVTACMGALVAYAAFGDGRLRKNLAIIRKYRPVHFLTNIPVIASVLTAAILLNEYVPFMDKNPLVWVFSFFFGGDGAGGANLIFSGIQWKWYALIFLPVLTLALPYLAEIEERSFREGTRNWKHGIVRSIRFGLEHLIMMISIGTAIALSIGGLWFTYQYFKGGCERSTTYHAVYNTMLVTLVFTAVILS